jgi:hypothetical protein
VASSGAVNITVGNFGQTVTATLDASKITVRDGFSSGAASYQWVRVNEDKLDPKTGLPVKAKVGKPNQPYTFAAADIGKTVELQVIAANCAPWYISVPATTAGDLKSEIESAVIKTNNSVTLPKIVGATYSIGGGKAQTSNTFGKLAADTEYTFTVLVPKLPALTAAAPIDIVVTTSALAPQKAPAKPAMAGKTDTSVTLKTITVKNATAEYGVSLKNIGTSVGLWQDTPEFTGLAPYTAYYFFTRLAATPVSDASPASAGVMVTTDKASFDGALGYTATDDLNEGSGLTVKTDGLSNSADAPMSGFTFQWYRVAFGAVTKIGVGNEYTLKAADIEALSAGGKVAVTAAAANCYGAAVLELRLSGGSPDITTMIVEEYAIEF